MNNSFGDGELSGPGGSGIENVSRSGRVRKKNSLLEGFESLDQVEKPKKKGEKVQKAATPKMNVKGGRGKKGGSAAAKTSANKDRKRKMTPTPSPDLPKIESLVEEGDLEMDLPSEYDEMSNIGANNYDSSDIDDRTNGHGKPPNKRIKLTKKRPKLIKTPAQSTYMMEKSFENKNRKLVDVNATTGKIKAARKDKGTPRVTAYSLWVKDQREMLTKKYSHMDPTTFSKKLSEVWAVLPANQKKMWKNKADKIMKKNLNIKNSAPIPTPRGKGKPRGRPRIHPVTSETVDSNGLNGTTNKITPPTKTVRRTSGNALKASDKRSSNSSKGSWKSPSPKTPVTSKSKASNGVALSKVSPIDRESFRKSSSFLSTSPSTSFSISASRQLSPHKDEETVMYKVTGNAPIDVAAHFALLGESLSIIGERLMDVERHQPVSGSLSVLMDSLLCAVTPLVCLTQQIPELNCIPQERLTRLLDHVAYIMPGL